MASISGDALAKTNQIGQARGDEGAGRLASSRPPQSMGYTNTNGGITESVSNTRRQSTTPNVNIAVRLSLSPGRLLVIGRRLLSGDNVKSIPRVFACSGVAREFETARRGREELSD